MVGETNFDWEVHLKRFFYAACLSILPFAAKADGLGMLFLEHQPDRSIISDLALNAMQSAVGVPNITVQRASNPARFAAELKRFQVSGKDAVFSIAPGANGAAVTTSFQASGNLPSSMRIDMLDVWTEIPVEKDVTIVLPTGSNIKRLVTQGWMTPMHDGAVDVATDTLDWIKTSQDGTNMLRKMGLVPLDGTDRTRLLVMDADGDDGCDCEDSSKASFMSCDPDGMEWSQLSNYLLSDDGDDDGCGEDCESGRFMPFEDFSRTSLFSKLSSTGTPTMVELATRASAGEAIFVFSCDPD